jgi:hypothetical protein
LGNKSLLVLFFRKEQSFFRPRTQIRTFTDAPFARRMTGLRDHHMKSAHQRRDSYSSKQGCSFAKKRTKTLSFLSQTVLWSAALPFAEARVIHRFAAA